MRHNHRATAIGYGLILAVTAACSSATGPDAPSDRLAGRWEGTSGAGIAYVYVFTAAGGDSTNPRTGNVARRYRLAFTTTPGGSDSVTAWFETPKAFWGGTSLGTILNDTTLMVEAQNLTPFPMYRRP